MSIVIFGGTGFLGISLLKKLEKNYDVKFMIHENKLDNLSIKNFHGDLSDSKTFEEQIHENDIVINMVGQVTANYSKLLLTNFDMGLNLLNICIKKKVQRVILTSSINVYGENLDRPSLETDPLKPETNYGHVKMLTEMMYQHFADRYNLDITVLRFSNLYGEKKKAGFIVTLLNAINHPNEKLILHDNGNQQVDILHVNDAVDGILNSIDNRLDGFNIINISSGKKYSIREIIATIEKISKRKIPAEYVNKRIGETCIWADNSKAKKILKFAPKLSIEEGFDLTIKAIIKN